MPKRPRSVASQHSIATTTNYRSETRVFKQQLACILIIATAALLLLLNGCSTKAVDATKQSDKKVVVKTVAVETVDLEQATTQPASVLAYHRAEIGARTSGYVSQLTADIGDYVEAGQTLAVIDVPEMVKQRQVLEARLKRFQSDELRAQAGLRLAQANINSHQAKVKEATARADQVTASLAAAEAEFTRTNDLVQRKSLQRRVLDEVRKNRDSVVASKTAVQSAIQSAEAEVTVAEAKLSSAEADAASAKAETEIVKRQLEELDVLMAYATLKAPFAGIVTQRNVDPGDLVTAKTETDKPLFVVSQIDKVRIHIPVPETDAARINKGDSVSLTFPSFPAESLTASVSRFAGELDPSTRTMLVEAEVANPDRKLIPGMFGQARIALATKTAANMLPARAVRFDEKGNAYVYALQPGDTVAIMEVATGIDNGQMIEVMGLSEGQVIIDANLKRLSDGQQVTIIN